jgi:hypothetical protein
VTEEWERVGKAYRKSSVEFKADLRTPRVGVYFV